MAWNIKYVQICSTFWDQLNMIFLIIMVLVESDLQPISTYDLKFLIYLILFGNIHFSFSSNRMFCRLALELGYFSSTWKANDKPVLNSFFVKKNVSSEGKIFPAKISFQKNIFRSKSFIYKQSSQQFISCDRKTS